MANNLDFAILIGVKYYKGVDPLDGPHDDLERFLTWLGDSKGGDLPKENIKSFTSTPTYTPTQDEIDEWFDEILNKLKTHGNQGRRLYFYFSGHGIGVNALNSAMLLPKWTYTMRNYALSSEKYLLELVNKGLFKEIFFFMDCCRNRIAGVSGQPPLWASAEPASKSSEYLLYYAAEFDNPAYEASLSSENGRLDNLLPRGLFTKVLLDGLNGAAADREGRLRVQDLVNYVKRKLPELALTKGKVQIPRPNINIDLEKEITGPFDKLFEISIEFKTPGMEMVLEDPDLNPVWNGNSSVGQHKIILKRGEHTLRKAMDSDGQKIFIDGLQKNFVYD